MKAQFSRQEMADALAVVGSVVATRTPKPILQCVRVEASSDFILLTATDQEIGVRYAVNQVEVTRQGDTLVSADKMASIVRDAPDDLLVMEMEGSKMHLRGADSHFQVVCQDPEDFPPVATAEGTPSFTVPFGEVRRLVEWTSFAAARESSRFAINGVLWELNGDKLTMAATDGRRLSCGTIPVTGAGGGAALSVIVPVKALNVLTRLGIDPTTPVMVRLSENQALFRAGPATLTTNLVEGKFPKYQEVIPTDLRHRVHLGLADFQSALKRAALLTNEESKGVRLTFSDNRLTIASRAPEQGEASISLAIEYKGEPQEIGFNPVFLLDVLRVAHTDVIEFAFKESNRPGVIRVPEDMQYVVMPVSL
jgi:DNA polymerase-3 subunit beta